MNTLRTRFRTVALVLAGTSFASVAIAADAVAPPKVTTAAAPVAAKPVALPNLADGPYVLVMEATTVDGASVDGHLPDAVHTFPVDTEIVGSTVNLIVTQTTTVGTNTLVKRTRIATGTQSGSSVSLRTMQMGANLTGTLQPGTAPSAKGTFTVSQAGHSFGGTWSLAIDTSPRPKLPKNDNTPGSGSTGNNRTQGWTDPGDTTNAGSTSSGTSSGSTGNASGGSWYSGISDWFSGLFSWGQGTTPSQTGSNKPGNTGAYCPNPPCKPLKPFGK
ncbi:MAG: hypothetical protein U0169_07130 [Polyangiaceae bacterium]